MPNEAVSEQLDSRLLIPAVIQFMGEQAENYAIDKESDLGWHSWILVFKTAIFRCDEGKIYLQERLSSEALAFWELPAHNTARVRVCTVFPKTGYTHETNRECYTLEAALKYLAEKVFALKALTR